MCGPVVVEQDVVGIHSTASQPHWWFAFAMFASRDPFFILHLVQFHADDCHKRGDMSDMAADQCRTLLSVSTMKTN